MQTSVPSWFAVLSDHAAAQVPAESLCDRAAEQIRHPSGRPWIVGSWRAGDVVVGEAGPVRIALLGQHGITADQLCGAAASVRTATDLDRLAGELPGSFYVIATVAGAVHAYGTVTGLRRVFYTRAGDTVVLADRAAVLAGLCDASLDPERLAVHLLYTPMHPLDERPLWRGVFQVPGGHCLTVDGHGPGRLRRWWTPPDPQVGLDEGAVKLRDALGAAVAARVRGQDLVTSDLGGLDSTSVCCLAARGDASVVAYTAAAPDPLADDEMWARRTVKALGNVEHEVIPQEQMPLMYHGLQTIESQGDEPVQVADTDRWLTIVRRAASRGSRMHLTGVGGDELLYGSVAHLHGLMRSHPISALRLLRGFMAKYRWEYQPTMAQLLDNRPYRRWLADGVGQLTETPAPSVDTPRLEWFFRPYMPPWASAKAVDAVRRLILAEVPSVEPLSRLHGQHRELSGMRDVCSLVRYMEQASAGLGVAFAAPYYDHPVITAGLSVRPQDRISPWRYKPLIVEAMRGIVPEESRTRQTKPHGTFVETGLRRNRAELLALWEGSRLETLGLVDMAALRDVCIRPMPEHMHHFVAQAASVEIWLRSLERSPFLASRAGNRLRGNVR